MKTFTKHLPHYFVLIGILIAGFLGLILFSYDTKFQSAIAFATAASYVSWGLVHHYIHKDLHLEVVIEYLVVAALGLTIIFSLILNV